MCYNSDDGIFLIQRPLLGGNSAARKIGGMSKSVVMKTDTRNMEVSIRRSSPQHIPADWRKWFEIWISKLALHIAEILTE